MTGIGAVRGERRAMAISTVALALGLAACNSSGSAKADTTPTVPSTTSVGAEPLLVV